MLEVRGSSLATWKLSWKMWCLRRSRLLIDAVCKEYGVRFVKERDGGRLAALISKEEINPEIQALIRESGV